MKNLSVSSPWITYWQEIKALFGEDPDIKLDYDELKNIITMRVTNQDKADALTELLPAEVKFGNVVLQTVIIPANTGKPNKAELIERALRGNPNFSQIIHIADAYTNPFHYVMFAGKVAQYWGDNLGDPHGNVSTLYQELAKKIFGEGEGIFYCTEPLK